MVVRVEVLGEQLKHGKTQKYIFGENGLIKQFVKALTERALQTILKIIKFLKLVV